MTRINTSIDSKELCGKHLLPEHREIVKERINLKLEKMNKNENKSLYKM